ncbi:DNA primase [Cyanothece sp. BG0011]|uniref:DNA primase n=1 Tax=Cyanothece sp. BG0011 TaxID=2082950 RepID=UPI000D1F6D4B|nr:DNA primase [Cyanothece sp. BG0011]
MKLIALKLLTPIKQWFHHYLVQEVPSNLSFCEFDCQETYCDRHVWQNCEKIQK